MAPDEHVSGHSTPSTSLARALREIAGSRSIEDVIEIIRTSGTFFGTLCAIAPNPAKVNDPMVLGAFKLFAELIAQHLDSAERLAAG